MPVTNHWVVILLNVFGKSKPYYVNKINGEYYSFVLKDESECRINKLLLCNKNSTCIKLDN